MSQLQVTPANQWRRDAEAVQLPSGKVATLRRINMLSMIRKGENVPNFLAAKVTASLNGVRKVKAEKEQMSPKDAIDSVFFLAMQAFVYPRVVEGEAHADDEVSIDHLSEDDIAFAASYATGDAAAIEAVAAFRNPPQAHVEPLPASEELVTDPQ
jgi:hypothetical protein